MTAPTSGITNLRTPRAPIDAEGFARVIAALPARDAARSLRQPARTIDAAVFARAIAALPKRPTAPDPRGWLARIASAGDHADQ